MKIWLRSLIWSIFFPLAILSQTLQIQNVQIQRPTPAALSEWSRNPNIVRIFIQNSGKEVYSDVRVGGIDIADAAVEQKAIRTQQLPEGVYTYCVWLLDATGTVLHRYAVCPTFEIILPEPPIYTPSGNCCVRIAFCSTAASAISIPPADCARFCRSVTKRSDRSEHPTI